MPLTFFRKASGSIAGPVDDIVKPEHVRLLDYEVEIGLVIGRDIPVGTAITADNLADYVCGLVVTNDVSARDVQLTKTQFYESKSYPTFTPVGPALVLLDADELNRFGELRLQLRVNGELRQDSTVESDMIYRPVQALAALARFQQLSARRPGDDRHPCRDGAVCAAEAGAEARGSAAGRRQVEDVLRRPGEERQYLHDGDVVEVTIGTDDDKIDLGTQRNRVSSHERQSRLCPGSDRRRRPDRNHGGDEACATRRRLPRSRPLGGRLPTAACRSSGRRNCRLPAGLGIAEEFASISRPAQGVQLRDPNMRIMAEFHRDCAESANGFPQANMSTSQNWRASCGRT